MNPNVDLAVESVLANLIRIQSVNPPGGETEVAIYLKHLFDEAYIPNEIVESGPGRGNFIASVGEGTRRLLYLSHTDVVPVAEGWGFPPFSGQISNGFVHGRGALDCKGLVAAEACAVIYLARNWKLRGKLIFAATADEEAGGTYGVKYLMPNFKDKIAADFVVNEGGEEAIKIGDKVCHFVQVGEKGTAWAKLKAKGRAYHGSVPGLGDNAVVKMAAAIKGLADYKPRVNLIPEVKQLVTAIAKFERRDIEVNEENVDQVIAGFKDKPLAEWMRAITRMTVSPNFVHGGLKTNIIPDSCDADVDIRVLPGQDKKYVFEQLAPILGEVEMDIPDFNDPSHSPSDSRYYRLVSETVKEVMGEVAVLPSVSAGATDSRFLRRVGIPSYGIGMLAKNLDPAIKQTVHGRDERIDIESLRLKVDFLVRLAQKYLGG